MKNPARVARTAFDSTWKLILGLTAIFFILKFLGNR